jgi:hypothetical protein
MDQDKTEDTEGTEEAVLSVHDRVMAELAKLKEDATYVPALPKGVVLSQDKNVAPDGYYVTRPCLEEFVAAGYKAEDYEGWFKPGADPDVSAWGPPWSNPNWTKDQGELVAKLPDVLVVRSQVRRTNTRTARARAPSRHRFKQFLFGDPSYRLVRNGERQVVSTKVLSNLDELIDKEAQGLLSVHFIDGRRLNLELLKGGLLEVEAPSLPAPLPNPPLDSAANDDPSGNPIPTFIDGTYQGDPAAAATLEQMLRDKAAEQGELPGEEGSDPLKAAALSFSDVVAAVDAASAEAENRMTSDVSDPLLQDFLNDTTDASELDGVTDNEMPRDEAPAATDADAVETPEVTETPVPDTVPDVKVASHKSGKKGNKR